MQLLKGGGAVHRPRSTALAAVASPPRRHTMVLCRAQHKPPIVVVGSINADLVLALDRLPLLGETLGACSLNFFPGGKGANQAAAAAKLGYPTLLVGQLGRDSNAGALRDALAAAGVQLQHVRTVDGPSGTAVILLQSSGENSIIIVGGANQAPWELDAATQQVIAAAGALLLQREVPEHVNIKAAQVAAAAGVPVLLDAGGVDAPLSDALLRCLTLISPNETELQRLTGGQPAETVAQVVSAAGQLQQQALAAAAAAGASQAPQPQQQLSVLVKRGTAGSLLVPPGGSPVTQQAAIPAAKVVDTTGAGDCYTAAYMMAVLEGHPQPLQFASAAASICVSRPGAMTSLPTRAEVDQLLMRL